MDEIQAQKKTGPAWRRQLRKAVIIAGTLLAAAAVTIDNFGQRDRSHPADAIVVLGARVEPGGAPGDSLRCRTLRAVHLYQEGMAAAILFTGGVGEHPPSEAQAARNLARSLGIPERACVLEEHSTSTWENAVNAAAICRERGWRKVVVVSDPYHLYRASRNFGKAGLEPYPSPARDCARNRSLLSRAEWAVRDTLLVIRDILMGRA